MLDPGVGRYLAACRHGDVGRLVDHVRQQQQRPASVGRWPRVIGGTDQGAEDVGVSDFLCARSVEKYLGLYPRNRLEIVEPSQLGRSDLTRRPGRASAV